MTPIAAWLKASRTAQVHPDTGRPWTQDYFLARIKAETGWAPAYANYNKLEQGKSQPRPETLARLVDFWSRYGVEAPDLTPREAETAPDLATALLALARSNEAMATELGELRRERLETAERVEALERAVRELAARLAAQAGSTSAVRRAPHGSAG